MPKTSKIIVRKKAPAVEIPAKTRKKKEKQEAIRTRNRQCLELRQTGATYRQIAEQFNLHDESHAKKCVESAISKVQIDASKDVVMMDLMRLDEMQMRATHEMRQNGNLRMIPQIMQIMEFRYRLLGVNDETLRSIQGDHGLASTTTVNNKNQVMVIQTGPEGEKEFIGKMMTSLGINPDSAEAKRMIAEHEKTQGKELPMLRGSANEEVDLSHVSLLGDDEIIDAEIVE